MKSNAYRSTLLAASVFAAASSLCFGQVEPVTLRITVTKRMVVPSSSLSDSGAAAPETSNGFFWITSVNGEPAQGSWTARVVCLKSIVYANVDLQIWTFNLFEADGTPAGTIVASGASDGAGFHSDLQTVSGTNAYYGVGGTISYDGTAFVATLTPLCTPTVATLGAGHAIVHAKDFTPVTPSSPTEAGETLSLIATDVLPELMNSAAWPSEPQALTNVPVEVKVGGLNAAILYAGMYPGARNTYQINFQAPTAVQSGVVDVQISTGFIGGAVATIPIR